MISGGTFGTIQQRRLLLGALLASVAGASLTLPAAAQAQTATSESRSFDIAPQSVVDALADFGRQSGLQVSMDADQVRGLSTQGVKGTMTPSQALDRLLASTGYAGRIQGRIVSLYRVSTAAADQGQDGATVLGPLRVEGEQAGSGGIGRNGHVGAGGAAGGADEIFAATRAVSIVTREEMDRTPARHAADLITEVPGVTSAVNRLNPGLSVNIRGMQDFGRVNMMIDGMRQNFVQNGHQSRNGQMYVDPELISGIVIERGPRNTVHGTGAIAGTVDFQTVGPDDILDGDNDQIGARLRGSTGLGGEGNGVNFLGSAAIAGRLTNNLEVVAAYSRRDIGDYDIGTKGPELLDYPSIQGADGTELVNRIKYASQLQESGLGKVKWTLGDHKLQLSYLGTWIEYDNVSDSLGTQVDEEGSPWRRLGHSKIGSENFAFDYSWKPDSNWIDLRLKLYVSNTRNRNYSDAHYPDDPTQAFLVDTAWTGGYCEREEIPASWVDNCGLGYGTDQLLRTRTYGAQLDNRSTFALGRGTTLTANYGGEFFQDRTHSDVTIDYKGRTIDTYNQYGRGDTLNPRGRRSMGSLFANFEVKNDLYTLGAGLRYEHYWLTGTTQVLGVTSVYNTRFDRFLFRTCRPGRDGTIAVANREVCRIAQEQGEAATAAYVETVFSPRRGYWNNPQWTPGWQDSRGFYDYKIDRSEGRFLPSFSAAIRPTSWLELYGSWAKSWRPPAINETLMVGGHPGDPIANMFPNPYADPEKTTSWELGANINFNGVFKTDDVFFAKVGFFSTKARDYLITSLANNLPGDTAMQPGLGRVMFVNNRAPMKFEGFEIEARYDAGFVYAGVAATIYTHTNERFVQDLFPLGVGVSRYDKPLENGSLTEQQQQAIAAGFPTWQAWLESMTVDSGVLNSVGLDVTDKVTATLGIRLFERKLDTGFRLIHSGAGKWYWQDDAAQDFWPSYTTLDWFGSFTLSRRARFFASIENLTDRRYIDGKSDFFAKVAAPGRTITGGIEVKF
ncbi:TonB-dependent receptor [Novosphingobium sp. M1R2S20]|uniref:TonB-dependent hemoglobin/transferrin/lactoferrin family receptor n=1 Tax=Novosphingobium rhizovicinum TaxID=3228928 RepID=A0ABV3RA64_9SPHN